MILPIVGSWFRPPAGILVKSIPTGSPLILRPEPENPHDPNAIAILIPMSGIEISEKDMPAILKGIEKAGLTPEEFSALDYVHLGYIPKEEAEKLQTSRRWFNDVDGKFIVMSSGKPGVQFDV